MAIDVAVPVVNLPAFWQRTPFVNATGHGGGATNQALTPQAQHHLAAATVQHLQMTLLRGIHAAFLAALLAAVLGLLVLLLLPGGSARDHAVRETAPTATADGAPRSAAPQDAPQRTK
jgi:ABC-type nitrate/sulfonate/bicarbonate transport system permease component